MFINTLSSSALFGGRPVGGRRPRSASSSISSSAFSSQQNFTQSDTEAEEERKFMKRRVQRRQVMTPGRGEFGGGGGGRRRDFLTPLAAFASCSTPKSSQEDLLLDQTSIYFRPLPKEPPPRYGRREGRERKMRAAIQQQQQKLISDFYRQSRRPRNSIVANEGNKRGSKTPQIARKRHQNPSAVGAIRRRHSSNPLMAFLEDVDGDEGRCSSPILLDFRATPESELEAEGEWQKREEAEGTGQKAKKTSVHSSNYAVPQKRRANAVVPYSNLSPFLSKMPPPPSKVPPSPLLLLTRQSNSDSGMEERNTEEGGCDWDKQTQFVNISDVEKIYENLPPTVPDMPLPPHQQRWLPPSNPPPRPLAYQQAPPPVSQLAEDIPALYGRLAAAAFVKARNAGSCGGGGMPPIANARRIRVAQRQLAELVGLQLTKGVELSGTLDSDENFKRKSADFGTQLAKKLRQTEACSRKEFNWQIKKLQKILHELRTAAEDENGEGGGGGALQKLFRRVFSWK